jgi:hypothetical protein
MATAKSKTTTTRTVDMKLSIKEAEALAVVLACTVPIGTRNNPAEEAEDVLRALEDEIGEYTTTRAYALKIYGNRGAVYFREYGED